MNKKNLIIAIAILLPLIVSADASPTDGGGGALDQLVQKITKTLNSLIVVLFAMATVYFFWGIIEYVIGSHGDIKKLDQGRQHLFWGLIGMTIMLGAWGIVIMIKNSLGV